MKSNKKKPNTMNFMPTWKSYLFLALVFLGCWVLFLLPLFERLVAEYTTIQLFFLAPFLTSFIGGIIFGRQVLAGTAVICFAAASIFFLADLETLMHDDTLMGALGYAAGIVIKWTCVVLLLMVTGAFVGKQGLTVKSTALMAVAAGISAYLLNGLTGSPVPYGLNYYTLRVLAVVFASTLALFVTALLTMRTTNKTEGALSSYVD